MSEGESGLYSPINRLDCIKYSVFTLFILNFIHFREIYMIKRKKCQE
jgi:hypothetical protein